MLTLDGATVGTVERVPLRFQVTPPDGAFVVGRQPVRVEDDKISRLWILCSELVHDG